MPKLQLAVELQNTTITKFEKLKLYASFKDNLWSTDLTDVQLVITYNKRFQFFCVSSILLVNLDSNY